MIFHMLPTASWQAQQSNQPYRCESLESEGFIHCTGEPERLLAVANRWYKNLPGDWLILCIEDENVEAEIRWEENHGHIFPHIYGPINLDAITEIIHFPRSHEGEFQLPSHKIFRKID